MPRAMSFYSEFFFTPLTEDVEQLLARFQHTDSVRYEHFSAIWREMSFSDVFLGLTREGEGKRFCRMVLATAMKYFLPPYSYQIRVGGLYLLFAFYHTQPAAPPVQIRLALKDWAPVQKFLKDSVDSGHLDVVYIYQTLVEAKAFHYSAMPHFLTFQKQRKPKNEQVCSEFLGRTMAIHDLLSAEIVEEVANIQNQYEKLKGATAEVSSQATMTHRDLDAQLKDYMSEFLMWQEKTFSKVGKKNSEDDEDEEEESSKSRATLLSSIKKKSFSKVQQVPKSRRHRQVEKVDSSGSGAEITQETVPRKKKPPSLRARTWKSLGMTEDNNPVQAWLLSAPDQKERVPLKKASHQPPCPS
ncbi:snRNA-activating protein complex subunit 1-like [Cheilinus undulatus]|uniref:snRNA-activating protein complex subunit 1-like n=1 Tax=Cheilinus undulatus TaxID=241271 RepID=UPI001BD6DA70|nr:snRNA-activating protein complex subunit 1-like [Cheilinus undulatus]